MLRILSSRWTEAAWVILLVVVSRTQSKVLFIAVAILGLGIVGAILVRVFPALRDLRSLWRKFPETEEYAEYKQVQDAKRKSDKNKIDIQ
ncbi:MAG: hypothetical protein RR330_02060 [Alistipes sp.]